MTRTGEDGARLAALETDVTGLSAEIEVIEYQNGDDGGRLDALTGRVDEAETLAVELASVTLAALEAQEAGDIAETEASQARGLAAVAARRLGQIDPGDFERTSSELRRGSGIIRGMRAEVSRLVDATTTAEFVEATSDVATAMDVLADLTDER